MSNKIEKNKVIAINYMVMEQEGALIDQSTNEKPLVYLHGHNNLIPGLEKQLDNVEVGTKLNVTVTPEEAYGLYDDSLVKDVSREIFFEGVDDIQEGMLFTMDVEDGTIPFYIKQVFDDVITIDGNHHLAGKTLVFEVEVLSIRDASDEEIAKGLPQID